VAVSAMDTENKKTGFSMNQKHILFVNRDINYLPVSSRGYIYVITIPAVFIVE
jgi:hypothetical protein